MYCQIHYQDALERELSCPIRENIVFPIIGQIMLNHVKTVHFSEIRSQLLAHYCSTTARSAMKNLYIIFQIAVTEGKIKSNPVTKDVITIPNKSLLYHKECRILSDEEMDRINKIIPFLENKDLISLGFITGIDLKCVRALRWTDIDFDLKQLTVYKKFIDKQNSIKEELLAADKIRIMKLPEYLVDYLFDRYEKTMIIRKYNPVRNADNYIFANQDGSPMGAYYINQAVDALGKMVGIENLTYKDLVNNSFNNAIKCGISINNIMNYYNCCNKTDFLSKIYTNKHARKGCNE